MDGGILRQPLRRRTEGGPPGLTAVAGAGELQRTLDPVVPEAPQRFENLVGAHLLKWVHFLQDSEGRDVELRYFRDVDGREVDFVVVEDTIRAAPLES